MPHTKKLKAFVDLPTKTYFIRQSDAETGFAPLLQKMPNGSANALKLASSHDEWIHINPDEAVIVIDRKF